MLWDGPSSSSETKCRKLCWGSSSTSRCALTSHVSLKVSSSAWWVWSWRGQNCFSNFLQACLQNSHLPLQAVATASERPVLSQSTEQNRRSMELAALLKGGGVGRRDLQAQLRYTDHYPKTAVPHCYHLSMMSAVPKRLYFQMQCTVWSPTSNLRGVGVAARLRDKPCERAWSTRWWPSLPISSVFHGKPCCLSSLLLKVIARWKIITLGWIQTKQSSRFREEKSLFKNYPLISIA